MAGQAPVKESALKHACKLLSQKDKTINLDL